MMTETIQEMDKLLQSVGLQKDSLELLCKQRQNRISSLISENSALRFVEFSLITLMHALKSMICHVYDKE